MNSIHHEPRIHVPFTRTTAHQLITEVQRARQAAAALQARYRRDTLFADACVCGAPTAPGLVWCSACAARVERLHALAQSATCLSCGDASNGPLCDACFETGEVIR